jgi:uncharacterized protein (DUF58 family)
LSVKSTRRASVIILLASVSIALGLIFLFEVPFLFAGLALIAYYYISRYMLLVKSRTLNNLKVERVHVKTVAENNKLEVKINLVNKSLLNLNLELFDEYPRLFKLIEGSNSAILSVPGKGFAQIKYLISSASIGAHEFGNIELTLRDPFSLFLFKRSIACEDVVYVTPSEKEVIRGTLVSFASSIYGGGLFSRLKGEGFEFAELREYAYGDPFRSIEWSATARSNKLMVRQNYSENPLSIMVILECSETMAYGEAGKTKLDYACRAVASLAGYAYRRGDFIGITFMKGFSGPKVIPTSRGADHLNRIVRELSRIKAEPGASNLEVALKHSFALGNIKGKTLFLVISDLNSEIELEPLRKLTFMNHDVVVVSPYTPLFETHNLVGVEKVLYSINVAYQYKTREKLLRRAAKLDIPVLDVGPDDIFEKILIRAEKLRLRGGS